MIIGYLFGIPISIWAVYFLIVKPLVALGERQPSNSVGGKAFHSLSVLVVVFMALAAVSIIGGILVLVAF
jgi:hypothetical protein